MFLELVDILRDRFVLRGFTEVTIAEGIEARVEQANFGLGSANRVAFVPAADPMTIVPPTFIGDMDDGAGGAKRQLWNVMFVYEVCFAAFDAEQPDRDLAHRRRCFDLWEVTAQEIQRAYYGSHEWNSARWETSRKHGVHGAELIATLTLNIPLFDEGSTLAMPAPVPGQPKPVT